MYWRSWGFSTSVPAMQDAEKPALQTINRPAKVHTDCAYVEAESTITL